jgi:hypothetical protein
VAQPEKTEPLVFPAATNTQTKIDIAFDNIERVVDRTERLIMKAKYLIFGFSFFLFLIYEMVRFGKYLWGGH